MNNPEDTRQSIRHAQLTLIPLAILLTTGVICAAAGMASAFTSDAGAFEKACTALLSLLLGAIQLRMLASTIREIRNLPYRHEADRRIMDNMVTFARWACEDTMALDDAERATQRTIRRYMDTNPNMGDQPARYATHITVLYELCDGIALARTPLRILMVFSGVIQTYPRHWREIDDTFRDAFTRYVNGTPLEDITPSIPMGEHTTLRLAGFAQSVNDYRMGD